MLELKQLIKFLNEVEIENTFSQGIEIVHEKQLQEQYNIPNELLDAIKISLKTAYDEGYYDAY